VRWNPNKSFSCLVFLFCLLLGSVSCGAQERSPKGFLSKISDVSKVISIELQSDWMGLSEFGPLKRAYFFKSDGPNFSGKATFSLGAGPSLLSKEFPVSVPRETVQAFLSQLSRSVLEKGEYKPKIDHTDDYPTLGITVEGPQGKVEFFSRSQGEFAIPWGVRFASQTYVVNTNDPELAFRIMDPYLKHEMMKSLQEEWRAKNLHR